MKSHFFCKIGCTDKSLATGTSRDNKKARLYFLSCSDLVILTLQLPTCFTCVLDSGESPLASQSLEASWLRTLDQFFTLSYTQPLHYSQLNTRFLNADYKQIWQGIKPTYSWINSTLQFVVKNIVNVALLKKKKKSSTQKNL